MFDAGSLDLPLVQADRSALELMRVQCERLLDTLGWQGDLVERVRHELWRNGGDGVCSFDEVAEKLAVSTRTLRRMLAADGTSSSICSTASDAKRRCSCSGPLGPRSKKSPSASDTRRPRTSDAPSITGRGRPPGSTGARGAFPHVPTTGDCGKRNGGAMARGSRDTEADARL